MPVLFGKRLSKAALLERVGDIRQVAGVRLVELADGPERGVRAAEVRTGSGLRFLVAADRGMDIADASWRGTPLAWISPTGLVNPGLYEGPAKGWLRSFHGGLLNTCGLSTAGAPSVDGGVPLGLHGRASNTPARSFAAREDWSGEEYTIELSGVLRESSVFGENLELRRTIGTSLGASSFSLSDRVANLGHASAPFMILYHINLGWPLLDEHAEIVCASCEDVPRDDEAALGRERARAFEPPSDSYKEKVYYRDLPAGPDGFARVALVNRRLALGVWIAYRKRELPNLVQWKMMGRGEYVCGLEPANCLVEGRAAERARGTLRELAPGETCDLELRIGVLGSSAEIEDFERSLPGRATQEGPSP